MTQFQKELEQLINFHSLENGSDTPDFILTEYLVSCLRNFNNILKLREKWYGREVSPDFNKVNCNFVPDKNK